MNNNQDNHSAGGIGFFGVLTIVFIVLKLVGVIDWAWWIVLLPLWGPVAALVLVVVLIAIVGAWRDD